MAKSGVTPKKFVHKTNGTPKPMKGKANPISPAKGKSPKGNPAKMAKGKPNAITPKKKAFVNGKAPAKAETPRSVEPSVKNANKKPSQKPKSKSEYFDSTQCLRLTFPHGQLRSIDQVKKLVPSAQNVKFPNVVFAEFASESEADSMHQRLQAMVSDNQLVSVSFIGEKERQYQATTRTLNQTRLFVRGIGRAKEDDIRRLFPTASAIIMRGNHKTSYCFVQYTTAAACKEALEKSKGLTLFGNPLFVNFAFDRPNEEPSEVPASEPKKRTLEQSKQPATKKSKVVPEADPTENDEESDLEEEEGDEEEAEDEVSDGDCEDEGEDGDSVDDEEEDEDEEEEDDE